MLTNRCFFFANISVPTYIQVPSFLRSSLASVPFRCVHSFIYQWLYSPLLGAGLLQFRNLFTQTVGLLGWVISPSQGHYLRTEQHKHRINSHTDSHASSGIRTHDPSVWAGEASSCLRPHAHCDRPSLCTVAKIQYSDRPKYEINIIQTIILTDTSCILVGC
jgi:hypothetical protein